jgi:hypothetical protein
MWNGRKNTLPFIPYCEHCRPENARLSLRTLTERFDSSMNVLVMTVTISITSGAGSITEMITTIVLWREASELFWSACIGFRDRNQMHVFLWSVLKPKYDLTRVPSCLIPLSKYTGYKYCQLRIYGMDFSYQDYAPVYSFISIRSQLLWLLHLINDG